MKKSKTVAVGLASAVAALMAGCSSESQTADCVDAQGRVIGDSYCQGGGSSYGGHWIYGGSVYSSGGYTRVSGGSTSPSEGASVTSRSGSSVSHGGFGGGGEGHGGGGHGGGE